jgi:hypothetical protein
MPETSEFAKAANHLQQSQSQPSAKYCTDNLDRLIPHHRTKSKSYEIQDLSRTRHHSILRCVVAVVFRPPS